MPLPLQVTMIIINMLNFDLHPSPSNYSFGVIIHMANYSNNYKHDQLLIN